MRFAAFRSLWGWEAKLASPSTLSNMMKSIASSSTFQGIELSLGDACLPFGGRGSVSVSHLRNFAAAVHDNDVRLIVGVYSSWQDYGSGGWEHLPVGKHVDTFKRQLDAVFEAGLQPTLVNAHSGSDSWTLDECHTYFRAALEHSKDLPCVVAHETHRGRCLFSPWQTQRLVQEFPDLKLTADVSHWTVVAERLLRSPEELQVIKTVVPAVRHIHGRVGGPQSPQVEAGVPKRSDELTSERSYFESVWSMIWEAQRAAGVQLSTFTPEYGPVGSGYSQLSHPEAVDRLIEDEAVRQRRRFKVLDRAAELQAEVVRPDSSKPVTYCELPLVDVGPLYDPHAPRTKVDATAKAVHNACITHGFLYIQNHCVPPQLVSDVLDNTRKFLFESPQAVKDSIGLRLNPNGGRGYQRFAENITYGSVDLHEGVDFLRDYDSPPTWLHSLDGLSDVYNTIVTSKNMFPPKPDGFSDLLRDYITGMKRVGHGLMRALALGLNLPQTYFNSLCTDPYWSMRLIGYPSVNTAADILARRSGDAEAVSATSVGVGEHCDYGCWTLLAVDPNVPSALQVRNAAGQWITADPIPGTLVVNIGDLLSLWSGGMYQSTPHRVVNHTTLDRVSAPFFFDPNFTAPAVPLPEVRDAIAKAGGPEPLWQTRLQAVQERMGFAQCAQGGTMPMFGLYHLRKVSTNFML